MTNSAAHLRDALADRYVLERELGRGGMATVYLARDLKHDRPVALKVLHPELAAGLGPERFLREIRTAARLDHPHILAVHDSGETQGLLWYTMPYVEGESLRERLRREGQLPVEEAARLTREVADALDCAHQHGVIHRDIKPENILLSGGHARVADFGVARALETTGSGLTESGMAVGTPAYMSPEQASAGPVDARTDLYALGCVLYELLAGEPPFTGPTAQAVIARRFAGPPAPLRAVRPSVPEALEGIVRKALEVLPADRFATAGEFARALGGALAEATPSRGAAVSTPLAPSLHGSTQIHPATSRPLARRLPVIALVLVFGVLLAGGALFAWRTVHRGDADVVAAHAPNANRLAVLPFDNLGDSADAYFADGVTDEVRGKLASLPGVEVIARTSSSQYRRTAKPPQLIARELGVRYLLTGTVRWEKRPGAGSRVRVSPELVDALSGTTRWQQPFDAPLTDVFQVQADIAGKVAEALDVALNPGERERLAERPTRNLDAYAHYLRGRELTSGENTPEALRAAAAEYRTAVELDSTFADAWAALAVTHTDLFRLGGTQVADTRTAERAAARAVALAPAAPDTRLATGRYAYFVTGGLEAALRDYRAGLQAAPSRSDLLAAAGEIELELGRTAEALTDLEHATRLDPRSPDAVEKLADMYLSLHRLPEAEAAITRARTLRPSSMALANQHARILAAQGQLDSVRRVLRAMEGTLGTRQVMAYIALREDLISTLDSAQLREMLTLTPADLDNGRADWGLALAEGHWLLGNWAAARAYGDTAAAAYTAQQQSLGTRGNRRDRSMQLALRALALAYAERATDAAAAARRAVTASPDHDYVRHLAARVYLLAGDPGKALDQLEVVVRLRGFYTAAWLRMDANFAPLRGSPRFERLVSGT